MSLVGYSPEYIEFANARRAYGMALNMRPSKRKDALVAERSKALDMARAALQNLLDRRKSTRSNPLPDPVYHGVKELPPTKAADGDTVVVPSPYKPGKFEVLIYGGDIVGGRYQEMWIYVGAYDRAEAIAKAKEAAA